MPPVATTRAHHPTRPIPHPTVLQVACQARHTLLRTAVLFPPTTNTPAAPRDTTIQPVVLWVNPATWATPTRAWVPQPCFLFLPPPARPTCPKPSSRMMAAGSSMEAVQQLPSLLPAVPRTASPGWWLQSRPIQLKTRLESL